MIFIDLPARPGYTPRYDIGCSVCSVEMRIEEPHYEYESNDTYESSETATATAKILVCTECRSIDLVKKDLFSVNPPKEAPLSSSSLGCQSPGSPF